MALDVGALKTSIEDLGVHYPTSPADAARRWAAAYGGYAAHATSCAGGSPASVAAGQAALEGLLLAAFSAPPSPASAPQTVQAFAGGLLAFWTITLFSGPVPGVAVAAVGAAALTIALPVAWAANLAARAPNAAAAQRQAQALDAATRLVVVTHPIPVTPCSGPIS